MENQIDKLFIKAAKINQDRAAIKIQRRCSNNQRTKYLSFSYNDQLIRYSDFCNKLYRSGVKVGHRVLVWIRPSENFVPLILALRTLGVIPVFIDPKIGRSRLKKCLKQSAPDLIVIDSDSALLTCFLTFYLGESIKILPLSFLGSLDIEFTEREHSESEDWHAILFTSGSTGYPKGVLVTEKNILAQVAHWSEALHYGEDSVELITFPLFAINSLISGRTAVIPDVDLTKPAKASGKRLLNCISECSVTHVFCSPTLLKKIAAQTSHADNDFSSLVSIGTGAAPVPLSLLKSATRRFKSAKIYVCYGATEALPLTSISFQEINNKKTQGNGICVGYPIGDVKISITNPNNITSSKEIQASDLNNTFETGSICASGNVVSDSYIIPSDNIKSKYQLRFEGERLSAHDTGDLGFVDDSGALWFSGRRSEALNSGEFLLPPTGIENPYNENVHIAECALVGTVVNGKEEPVLLLRPTSWLQMIKCIAAAHQISLAHQHKIKHFIMWPFRFPKDKRHNAKIDRIKLRRSIKYFPKF